MKITYEFDPIEDRYDLEIHQIATKLYSAINDYKDALRSKCKYEDKNPESWDQVRDLFFECFEGINLDI
jgi:hypothetical protein